MPNRFLCLWILNVSLLSIHWWLLLIMVIFRTLFRHYQTLSDTIRHYQTLSDTMRHYETLSETIRQYQTLSDTIRHYETLWDTIRHYTNSKMKMGENVKNFQSTSISYKDIEGVRYYQFKLFLAHFLYRLIGCFRPALKC